MSEAIVVLCIFLYLIFGVIIGFSASSHKDVLAGHKPNTKSRIILFLARPTREIRGLQRLLFIICMLLWIPVFLTIGGAPILLAAKYAPEYLQTVFILLVPCVIIGKLYGSHKWRQLI